jgi:hypothetical protein
MTLFDFRQFVESMIPAWVPFVVAAIGIVGIVFLQYINSKATKKT